MKKMSLFFFSLAFASILSFADNLLPGDSSFETGFGAWGKCGDIKEDANTPDGKNCVEIKKGALTPERFHLDKGQEYTFSCYLRADKSMGVHLGALKTNWSGYLVRKYVHLDKNWKRYELNIPAQDVNNWVWLDVKGSSGVFYLDACQLEKGGVSKYAAALPVVFSADVKCPVEGGLFYPEEKIEIKFSLYNTREQEEKVSLFYDVKSYYDETVKKENISIIMPPKSHYLYTITFEDLKKKGFYIVDFGVLGNKKTYKGKSVSFCVIEKPLPFSPQEGSLFAVSHIGIPRAPAGERMGVKWSSAILSWSNLEKEKGKYDFSKAEKAVDFLKKHNYNLIGYLRRTPQWAREYKEHLGRAIPKADAVPEYEKFVFETVSRFKDKIHCWSSWGGEFDLGVRSAAAKAGKSEDWVTARFVELTKAGYRGAKRADPNCLFGDPVQPSGVDCNEKYVYTRKVFALGGDHIDFLGLDCYSWPRYFKSCWKVQSPEEHGLTKILKEGVELAGKRQCWIAEYGFGLSVKEKMDSVSAKKLADYMARSYILAASVPGINKLQWFSCWDCVEGESSYDMWRWPNPLPVTAAYSALAQVLTGAKNPQQINMGSYIRAYSFERKGDSLVCIWVPSDKKVNIKLDVKGLKIIDIMGNEVNSRDGKLELSGSPLYLLSKMPVKDLSKLVAGASIDLIPLSVELRLVNRSNIKIYLTNRINKKLSGEIELKSPFKCKKQFAGLRPGVAEAVEMALPGDIGESGVLSGLVKTNQGDVAFSRDISLIPCVYMNKKVVVDGDLSEWEGRPYFEMNNQDSLYPPDAGSHQLWTGEDDLSGKFYCGWDESNFYFAAKVRDDRFINNQEKKRIWSGDAIQLGFDPENDAIESEHPGYEDDDHEFAFGFSQKLNKPVVYQYWPIPPSEVDGCDMAVKRSGDYTIYELALPFSKIAPLQPVDGKIFGYNFVMVDHDSKNARSYGMNFSPGILGGKIPAAFKKFIFTKKD